MVAEKNKTYAITMTKGKCLTQQYQPMEGLFKLNYYGRAKKREKVKPDENESIYITDEY